MTNRPNSSQVAFERSGSWDLCLSRYDVEPFGYLLTLEDGEVYLAIHMNTHAVLNPCVAMLEHDRTSNGESLHLGTVAGIPISIDRDTEFPDRCFLRLLSRPPNVGALIVQVKGEAYSDLVRAPKAIALQVE